MNRMGYKVYSDSTLMKLPKRKIIELLRVAEHNYFVTDEALYNSAQAGRELAEKVSQPAQTAQWEFVHYDPDYLVYSGTCTACKRKHESTDNVGKLPFCPHCGAQMNGVKAPVLISADESGE